MCSCSTPRTTSFRWTSSRTTSGHRRSATWSIELNLGSNDPVDTIMLHVRGSGDDVVPVIARIAGAVGGRALDISTGDFLTGDPAETAGWHGFQRYRDHILGPG